MEAALAVGISITVIMLSALVFDRLRLPHILGVLVAGMLIGPFSPLAGTELFGINFSSIIITDPSLVATFALIGSALILFGIGLEFSIVKLSEMGLFTFLAAVAKIGIVYFAGYASLVALGFSPSASAIVAAALSFSSTPIIIRLLEDSGKIKRQEVQFIISILIIEDLVVVFFLGLLSNPAQASEYSFALSILRVVLTFIFAYLVLSKLINKFLALVAHSDELTVLATVSLVLVIGYVSEAIGLSFSVGAFLAGSTIAGSPHSRRIEEIIKPFNSLFAAFFFFSIGLMVNINSVFSNFQLLILFIGVGMGVRFAASGTASYLAGFPGRNACFCAAVFLSMSELSLLLVSQGTANGLVPQAFLGSFAFAIIASSFMSAWLINKENELYNLLQSTLPQMLINNLRVLRSTALGMRRAVSESSRYYNVIEMLPSISSPSQHDSLSVREQLILTTKNSAILFVISISCYLGMFFAQIPEGDFLNSLYIFIFTGFMISSALLLVNIMSASSAALALMARSSRGVRYHAVGHAVTGIFFFAFCAIFFWAYSYTPPSLAFILALPSLAFGLRSFISAAKAFSFNGSRL
ncbi:MAG: cation:proton antiporter [Candidatus Micrarchaeota archaeon]|nr:cation:proton antiporter [Candidatus Micrarchaeota archaeon]